MSLTFSYQNGVVNNNNLIHTSTQYLVSDLDKEDEDNDNKQVVENTDNSNDDVDDLECKVTGVENIRLHTAII